MGNTESRSTDSMIDYLIREKYITQRNMERAFRLVERPYFLPETHRRFPHLAEQVRGETGSPFHPGRLHVSAIGVYAQVAAHLRIKRGQSFMNIGTGSGYFSTIIGILLGDTGINHGIEVYQNLIDYSEMTINRWIETTGASSVGWTRPDIRLGDVHDPDFTERHANRYDRIYVGFVIHDKSTICRVVRMLRIGGILVAPMHTSMCRYTRLSDGTANVEILGSTTFSRAVTLNDSERPSPPFFEPIPSLAFLSRQSLRQHCRRTAYNTLVVRKINKSLRIPKGGLNLRRRRRHPDNLELLREQRRRDREELFGPFPGRFTHPTAPARINPAPNRQRPPSPPDLDAVIAGFLNPGGAPQPPRVENLDYFLQPMDAEEIRAEFPVPFERRMMRPMSPLIPPTPRDPPAIDPPPRAPPTRVPPVNRNSNRHTRNGRNRRNQRPRPRRDGRDGPDGGGETIRVAEEQMERTTEESVNEINGEMNGGQEEEQNPLDLLAQPEQNPVEVNPTAEEDHPMPFDHHDDEDEEAPPCALCALLPDPVTFRLRREIEAQTEINAREERRIADMNRRIQELGESLDEYNNRRLAQRQRQRAQAREDASRRMAESRQNPINLLHRNQEPGTSTQTERVNDRITLGELIREQSRIVLSNYAEHVATRASRASSTSNAPSTSTAPDNPVRTLTAAEREQRNIRNVAEQLRIISEQGLGREIQPGPTDDQIHQRLTEGRERQNRIQTQRALQEFERNYEQELNDDGNRPEEMIDIIRRYNERNPFREQDFLQRLRQWEETFQHVRVMEEGGMEFWRRINNDAGEEDEEEGVEQRLVHYNFFQNMGNTDAQRSIFIRGSRRAARDNVDSSVRIEFTFDESIYPEEVDGDVSGDDESDEFYYDPNEPSTSTAPPRRRQSPVTMYRNRFRVHIGPPLSFAEMFRRESLNTDPSCFDDELENYMSENVEDPIGLLVVEERARHRRERDIEIDISNNEYGRIIEHLPLPPTLIAYLKSGEKDVKPL